MFFWKCFVNYNNQMLFSCSGISACVQHEVVWSRCMAPLLTSPLNMSFQFRTSSTLHQGEGHASTYVVGVWVGTRKSLAFAGNRKSFVSRSASSLVTVPATLSPLVFPCGTLTLCTDRRLNILLLCLSL